MEEIFPQMASEGDDTFDYEPYTDELAASFHHAGLLELADDIREGIADSAEIKRVLVRLLLHNRIPYLPAPFQLRDSRNLMESNNAAEIDPDDPDLQEFLDSLPPDVDVIRAFFCDAPGVEGWIVAVEIETEIGHLSDCFTLTPVPRSIDMSWLTSR